MKRTPEQVRAGDADDMRERPHKIPKTGAEASTTQLSQSGRAGGNNTASTTPISPLVSGAATGFAQMVREFAISPLNSQQGSRGTPSGALRAQRPPLHLPHAGSGLVPELVQQQPVQPSGERAESTASSDERQSRDYKWHGSDAELRSKRRLELPPPGPVQRDLLHRVVNGEPVSAAEAIMDLHSYSAKASSGISILPGRHVTETMLVNHIRRVEMWVKVIAQRGGNPLPVFMFGLDQLARKWHSADRNANTATSLAIVRHMLRDDTPQSFKSLWRQHVSTLPWETYGRGNIWSRFRLSCNAETGKRPRIPTGQVTPQAPEAIAQGLLNEPIPEYARHRVQATDLTAEKAAKALLLELPIDLSDSLARLGEQLPARVSTTAAASASSISTATATATATPPTTTGTEAGDETDTGTEDEVDATAITFTSTETTPTTSTIAVKAEPDPGRSNRNGQLPEYWDEQPVDMASTAFSLRGASADLTHTGVRWNPIELRLVHHGMEPEPTMDDAFVFRDPTRPHDRVHPDFADKTNPAKVDPALSAERVLLPEKGSQIVYELCSDPRMTTPLESRATMKQLQASVLEEIKRLMAGTPQTVRCDVRRLQRQDLPAHESALVGQFGSFAPAVRAADRPTLRNGRILGLYMGALTRNDAQLDQYHASHPGAGQYDLELAPLRGQPGPQVLSALGAANAMGFANTALLPGAQRADYDASRCNAEFVPFRVIFMREGESQPIVQSLTAVVALDNLYNQLTNPTREIRIGYGPGFLGHFEEEAATQTAAQPFIKPEPHPQSSEHHAATTLSTTTTTTTTTRAMTDWNELSNEPTMSQES